MKDDAFIRGKVPMTKESVRALSIDQLELEKADRMLDIGAGTGSISIQAAYLHSNLDVTAVEYQDEAIDLIQANADQFNLTNVRIIKGMAPDVDLEASTYDAIFIGGSKGRLKEIIDWAFELSRPGASLVLNFILLENAMEALEHIQQGPWQDWDMKMVNIASLSPMGYGHYFKPQNPTYIIKAKRGK